MVGSWQYLEAARRGGALSVVAALGERAVADEAHNGGAEEEGVSYE